MHRVVLASFIVDSTGVFITFNQKLSFLEKLKNNTVTLLRDRKIIALSLLT